MKKFFKRVFVVVFLVGVGAVTWHLFGSDVKMAASDVLNDASAALKP